jgi:DNA-binding MarR family transcriptional regulator
MEELNREESLTIAGQCTYFHIKKLDRIIYSFYDKVMAGANVSPHQFSLLNSIYLAEKKLTITEFAKILAMDRTTLTRNLKLLEKNGFIKISASQQDSRRKVFHLTDKGEKTLKQGLSVWKKAQKAFIKKVGVENWESLMKIILQFEKFQDDLSQ